VLREGGARTEFAKRVRPRRDALALNLWWIPSRVRSS
jgi:hypothetical protein